ncbi:hypothetical protein MRX96_008083 [Rhipicephalus microplus]
MALVSTSPLPPTSQARHPGAVLTQCTTLTLWGVPPVVGRASASGHVLAYAVAPSYLVKATPYESLALANLGYPAYIHGEYGRRKRNAVYQQ